MKFIIFVINLIFFISIVKCSYTPWLAKCDFKDSVNITGGSLDDKGNYLHNGIIYSPGTFQSVNFIKVNFSEIVLTLQHVRGCICFYKPCLRICCDEQECIDDNLILNIYGEDELEVEIDLNQNIYGVLRGRPCQELYRLEPEDYDEDKWLLLNVSLLKFYIHNVKSGMGHL